MLLETKTVRHKLCVFHSFICHKIFCMTCFVLWNRTIAITFTMVLRRAQTASILFTVTTVILVICKQSPYLIAAKSCLRIEITVITITILKIKDSHWDTFFLFSGQYFRIKNCNQVFNLICLKLIWKKILQVSILFRKQNTSEHTVISCLVQHSTRCTQNCAFHTCVS